MDRLAPGPIEGGWSVWDRDFSTCSRTCGGGVKIKRRRCDNPPYVPFTYTSVDNRDWPLNSSKIMNHSKNLRYLFLQKVFWIL